MARRLHQRPNQRTVVPSLLLPFWLVLAAAADPLSPPPLGAPPVSGSVTEPDKAQSSPVKPTNPERPKSPDPAASPAKPEATAKAKSAPPAAPDEPEEEDSPPAKAKSVHKPAHRQASSERTNPGDHKSAWSADRYAAIVPPGLTLAALRAQLAKGPAAETGTPTADGPGAALADIERAREALRQETARLEALLKATGNCTGMVGMPIGDGLATAPTVPAAVLRETPSEQIDSVSKAFKGMKPEQAAPVVARLDRALASEIMLRMKPADAGAILGLLKPELAAELATQIATRRSPYGKDKKGAGK